MHQSEGGSRERGGSFAAPNERATSSTSSKENEIQNSAIATSTDKESLDDPTSRTRIQDQCVPDRLYCSPPSRPRQGTSSKTILPISIPTTQPIRPVTLSPRGSHPEPPVTKATLAELDVPRIVLNPKLRHDVNFDPDLHFRPNLDGEKGKKKLKKANEFWDVLKVQMQSFTQDPVSFELQHTSKEWCLPSTLRAIGDILETLVPPEDRSAVAAIMNVDMLMQQLGKGVADLESLAEWLAKTLKQHCAPMRDDWVNEMVAQLCKGNRENDINQIVAGLQTLMGVLEAMKLDVANHQIRCLRPLLVQDTVDFEQSFFMKKIAARKVDVTYAHAWLHAARVSDPIRPGESSALDLDTFVKAFTTCLLPSQATRKIPETFQFDEERVVKLRADVLDAVNFEVCLELFRKAFAESQQICEASRIRTQTSYTASRASSSRSSTPSTNDELSCSGMSSTSDFNSKVQASFTATERGHFRKLDVSDTLVWEPHSSSMSSVYSMSPGSSRSSTPLSHHSSRLQRSQNLLQTRPTEAQEASLLTQLNAILEDTISGTPDPMSRTRWLVAAPSLALAILHATSHPVSSYTALLPRLETVLTSAINIPLSQLFLNAEQAILNTISSIALHVVKSLAPLNNTRVFEVSVLPKGKPMIEKLLYDGLASCPEERRQVGKREGILEIVRGLSHVAVLHWKVWHPLCYTIDPDAPKRCSTPEVEMSGMETCASTPSPQALSSMMRDKDLERRRRDRDRETRRSHLKRRSTDRSPTP